MNKIIDVDGFQIEQSRIDNITKEIIDIFAKENITHAIAYMILDEIKIKLESTIVKSELSECSNLDYKSVGINFHRS